MLLLETLGQSADPLGKAQNRIMSHTFEHFMLHAAARAPFSSKVVLSLQSEAQTDPDSQNLIANGYRNLSQTNSFLGLSLMGRRTARGPVEEASFID